MNTPPLLPGEEWRTHPDLPDYLISSLGRVWSKPRTHSKGGVLKIRFDITGGYAYVRPVTRDGRQKTCKIHRLVAEVFVPGSGDEVRHLNGNCTDNRASNLAWGSKSENNLDRVRHGTHHNSKKTSCKRGHPFDSANTGVSNGKRYCRTCVSLKRKGKV